jgi:hypothetical protein
MIITAHSTASIMSGRCFVNSERLALDWFLAGYRSLTGEALRS